MFRKQNGKLGRDAVKMEWPMSEWIRSGVIMIMGLTVIAAGIAVVFYA